MKLFSLLCMGGCLVFAYIGYTHGDATKVAFWMGLAIFNRINMIESSVTVQVSRGSHAEVLDE